MSPRKRPSPARSPTAAVLWIAAFCALLAVRAVFVLRRKRRLKAYHQKAMTIVPVNSQQRQPAKSSPHVSRRRRSSERGVGTGSDSEGLLADTEACLRLSRPFTPAFRTQLSDPTPTTSASRSPCPPNRRKKRIMRSSSHHQPHQHRRRGPEAEPKAEAKQNQQVLDTSSLSPQRSWPPETKRVVTGMKKARSCDSLACRSLVSSATDEHPSATKQGELDQLRHNLMKKAAATFHPLRTAPREQLPVNCA